MSRHAVPLILVAVLCAAGGGAATWALASSDNPTSKGNEAPIDDNHRGSPGPAAQRVVTTPRPTDAHQTRPEVGDEANPEASAEPSTERSHDGSDDATSETEPSDDRSASPEPEPSKTEDSGRDGNGDGGSDDGSGHR